MDNQVSTKTRDQIGIKSYQALYMTKVYNWMALALLVTGVVAYITATTPQMIGAIVSSKLLFYGLILGELGLVIYLTAAIRKMSMKTAIAAFLIYSALNGLTMSVIFLVYTTSSISTTFFVTAGTFAAMSFYGYTTKKDLTSIGNMAFMALIGIIIASIVNLFLKSTGMQMIISYIGVLVFIGLTAYDTQKLKNMAMSQPAGLDAAVVRKGSIIGALTLYLDFILMFQYLLMIFGGSRD